LIRHRPHRKRRVNNSIVACVFVTAVTFLPSCCLATIGTYTQTEGRDLFNYAVEMGSGAVIYILNLIKTGSGIQMLIVGDTQTAR
jgi:hypothetical protein